MKEQETQVADKIVRVYLPLSTYEEYSLFGKDDPVERWLFRVMSQQVMGALVRAHYLKEGEFVRIIPDIDFDADEYSNERMVKVIKLIRSPSGNIVNAKTKRFMIVVDPEDYSDN